MKQFILKNKKLSIKVLVIGIAMTVIGIIMSVVGLLKSYSTISCNSFNCTNNASGLNTDTTFTRIGIVLVNLGFVCIILAVVVMLFERSKQNKK